MRHTLIMLFSTLAAVTVLSGCGGLAESRVRETDNAGAQPDKETEVRIPIHVSYPSREDIAAYFETTSRVQAENQVEVISKGNGLCEGVFVEEGDRVTAGQVLAELDKQELKAQLSQTRVNVQQSKYQMQKAEEQLKEGLLSPYEAENARFAYEQAKATLEVQEVQLSHQTVRAPIDGVVTQRNVQKGMLVSAGMPLFHVVDPDSFVLPISPPEKELPRLEIGQKAKITIDSFPDREFVARIERINPSVDPTTGTVKVVLEFDAEVRKALRQAAFARVQLVMETHENALLVPKDAIIEENARSFVMAVREMAADDAEQPPATTPDPAEAAEPNQEGPVLVAERVEVKTGLEDSDHVEVLEGIDEETRIVTLGQHTLKSGSLVTITNAEEEILSRAGIVPNKALAIAKKRQEQVGG